MDRLDEICPPYVGERLVIVQLSKDTLAPQPFSVVDVLLDFSACKAYGDVVLPIEITVTAPTPANFRRMTYRHIVPRLYTFRPCEAGRHLVRVAEVGHNRFWGALLIEVTGERSFMR